MEVVYQLPPDTRAFRATATLGFGDWSEADLEVIAERPGGRRETIATTRLTRDHEHAEIVARFPPDAVRLALRLLEGERGPVQDRLRLEGALLIIDR